MATRTTSGCPLGESACCTDETIAAPTPTELLAPIALEHLTAALDQAEHALIEYRATRDTAARWHLARGWALLAIARSITRANGSEVRP